MKLRRFALLFMLSLLICCPGTVEAWTPSAGWDVSSGGGDVVDDTSPELGGDLDAAGNKIYDSTQALNLGTAAASGHSLGTGDVIVGGKLEVDGSVFLNGATTITQLNTTRMPDDNAFGLGAPDYRIIWETADANSNQLHFYGPEGDATNVPVVVFGDLTIHGADLGFFDGYTEPNIAVVDDDGDWWGSLGFAEDDHFSLNFNGDMKLGYDPNAANDNIGVLQFIESDGTDIPILVISDASFAPNGDATFDDITEPTIAIMNDAANTNLQLTSAGIVTSSVATFTFGNRASFNYALDLSIGNAFSFDQLNLNYEFTDTNGRQAMIYVGGEVAQASTASFDMLWLDATTTSLGDGSTGDGNNFISARDDTVIKFKLGLDGVMQLYADPVFLGYSRHIDIQAGTAFLGPTAPTANSVGYARVLGFDADGETAHFNWEVPGDWDGASNFTVEVIWTGTEGDAVADTEKVKMDINYYCIAEGEALDNGTPVEATTTYTASGNQTDKEMFETDITIVYTGGNQDLTKGETVTMEFNRDVTGEAGDAYSGACQVLRWEIKYTATGMPYQ